MSDNTWDFPIPMEDFRRAYEVTGLRPVRRWWYKARTHCACPISTLAASVASPEQLERIKSCNWSETMDAAEYATLLRGYGYWVTDAQARDFAYGVDGKECYDDPGAYDAGVRVREEIMRPIARAMREKREAEALADRGSVER